MGLAVDRVELRDWRNFAALDVRLGTGLTILHGRNAVGKTTVVEALQLLTAGVSFRHATPSQLVRDVAEAGRASARLRGDGRVVDVSCDVAPGRRTFRRNGKRVRAHEMPGTLMSVLFCPDDLSLVKRGAAMRRDEVDGFGWQANRGYARVLHAYQRAVEQRNRLLRDEMPDHALLDAWDASVAIGGATLLQARMRLVSRLGPHMTGIYREISGGEELGCAYVCTLGDDAAELGRDELAARFVERLAVGRGDDLRRGQTLVGPHRDDVSLTVDGRDARSFASQGQQRSIVLAWKMAEVALAEEVVGSRPLLLLDDVMSELDGARREAAMRFAREGMQAVVTTVNLGYFSDDVLRSAKVVGIGD